MSNYRSMPKLLDEPPISLYPSLAVAFGNVNLAIIFQQLHFLMNVAETAQNNYVHVDGRWWVYNSYTEWKDKYFQWLGVSTLKALFGVLEEKGLVLSRQGVKDKFDRRKWYTINYEAYEQFIQSNGQNLTHEQRTESSQSDSQQMSRDNKESETPYLETTKESKRTRKSPKQETSPEATALINAWAEAMGYAGVDIGASFDTAANIKQAKVMLEWSTPATPEEVRKTVILKRQSGKDYAFAFLVTDIPTLRAQKRLTQPAAPAKALDLSEWTADSVWGWSAES